MSTHSNIPDFQMLVLMNGLSHRQDGEANKQLNWKQRLNNFTDDAAEEKAEYGCQNERSVPPQPDPARISE